MNARRRPLVVMVSPPVGAGDDARVMGFRLNPSAGACHQEIFPQRAICPQVGERQ
jgi:hypothetical protein